MRFFTLLWLVVYVPFTELGCAAHEQPLTELSVDLAPQPPDDKQDNPVANAAPAIAEWQWREFVGPLDGHVDMVAFSQDGKLIAAGAKDNICVWAIDTGKLVTRMTLPEDQLLHRLIFTPDGKSLVSDCREDRSIRFWDVKTGKQTRELSHPQPRGGWAGFNSPFRAFDPSGKLLVRVAPQKDSPYKYEPQLIDLATGKETVELQRVAFTSDDMFAEVSFAADGKTFATNTRLNRLEIFETATGDLVKQLQKGIPDVGTGGTATVRFSPDGRFLIAREFAGRGDLFHNFRYVIWGAADGRRYWQRADRPGWISAGNRYVLSDHKSVFDLLTDQDIPIKNSPAEPRGLVGMSVDGKLLAFVGAPSAKAEPMRGSQKLSVYLTPTPVLPLPDVPPGKHFTPKDLDAAWVGAVADNLFRREHSLKILAMRPGQTAAFAEKKVTPVSEAEGKRVADLVVKLDDDSVDIRDAATAELHQVAFQFEPYLKAAQLAAKAGEVRNRLIRVVQKIPISTPPPELVAELRGIAILEELRIAEARTLLEKIAEGYPGARVTDEAAAALKRLGKPRP